MERRFVVALCNSDEIGITESELMKRMNKALHTARVDVTEHITNEDEVIEVLLHVEKEQPSPIYGTLGDGQGVKYCEQCLEYHNTGPCEKEQEVAHITKCTCERCSGIAVESLYEEPTRKEWKQMMPSHYLYDTWQEWVAAFSRWFREEPPKPTRQDWEEWAEKKPHPFAYRTTPDKQIDFAAWHYATMYWFLTMPGVPK